MGDVLIVFKADIGFQTSELVKANSLGPGVEVSEVSFSIEQLSSNRPLEFSMTLVGVHELPVFMERVKTQGLISSELDFYDVNRLNMTPAVVGKTGKNHAIFMSISSARWRVVSAGFSFREHASGGVVDLVLTVDEGSIISFLTDDKGTTSVHNRMSWGMKN